jgi:predicted DNA-binding transcriptional regulator YafY
MKIDSLISIMMVLLNCERMSATRLADLFEVTPRTIYRDVAALEQAGIPVFTMAGAEGGIGIVPEYKVDKSFFTVSDIQTLLMGLDSISTRLVTKGRGRYTGKSKKTAAQEEERQGRSNIGRPDYMDGQQRPACIHRADQAGSRRKQGSEVFIYQQDG